MKTSIAANRPSGDSLFRAPKSLRIARFATVGCSNALISFLVFHGVMQVSFVSGSARIALAQTTAYALGATWSFFWNRCWTFAAKPRDENILGQYVRFVIVQASSLLASVALLSLLIETAGWNRTLSWLIAMSIITIASYLATARWVFSRPPPMARN